jgi:hypothetical protein
MVFLISILGGSYHWESLENNDFWSKNRKRESNHGLKWSEVTKE